MAHTKTTDKVAFACTLHGYLAKGGGLRTKDVAEWCRCSDMTVWRWASPSDPRWPDGPELKALFRNAPPAIARELRVAMFGDADLPDTTVWTDDALDPNGDGKVDGGDVTELLASCGQLNATTLTALLRSLRSGKRFTAERGAEIQAELAKLGVLVSQTKAALRRATLVSQTA